MKKFGKRMLTAVLAASLCIGCAVMSAGATVQDGRLRYNSNGKFTVLTFTDTHLTQNECEKMLAFMGEAIDSVKPDLVVFNGDNLYNTHPEEEERAEVARLLSPLIARNQPFAFVFGNHDPDGSGVSKEQIMAIYQEVGGELCLAIDEGPQIEGCGNYNLPIYSSKDAEKILSNIYFLDSQSGAPGETAVEWYRQASNALKAQNGGEPVPSLLFQHIIVPEIYELFYPLPDWIPAGSLSGLIDAGTYMGTRYSSIPNFLKLNGIVLEHPCPPEGATTTGELDVWAEQGDLLTAIFGHDHINQFTVNLHGVTLTQIPGTTISDSYGSDPLRGATVFTLDENNPWSYEQKQVTYYQLALKPGSKIGLPTNTKNPGEFFHWILYFAERLLGKLLDPVRVLLGTA